MAQLPDRLGFKLALLLAFGAVVLPSAAWAQGGSTPARASGTSNGSVDWLTWGGGPERHSWAKAETTLSPSNVSRLQLKWMSQLDNQGGPVELSTITAPLVVTNVATRQGSKTVVYVVGSKDIVYA